MKEKMNDILEKVCRFMGKEEIEYVIVGGIAVLIYGRPRSTMDVDIIIKIKEEEIANLVEFLKENEFRISSEDLRQVLAEKSNCTAFYRNSLFRLDIRGVYTHFDRKTLQRRKEINYEVINLFLASPEDTLLNKILFGSEKDTEDAESVWLRQEGLDLNYMEEMSRKLGIEREYRSFIRRMRDIS